MKSEIRIEWQREKCVGAPPGRGTHCLPLDQTQFIMGQ